MRCRVGDLAVIVAASDVIPENIGRIVSIVGYGRCRDWRIRSEGSPLLCLYVNTNTKHYGTEAESDDRVLRPIRPDPYSDHTQEEKEKITKDHVKTT